MPEVIRATWMRMLKFFFFPLTFTAMYDKPVSKGTPLEKGLAGAIAVTPEVATITTLELAKIGLQLDSQKRYNNSAIALVKDVYAKRGALGCMAGWQGVQARQMLWTGTYFATIDLFKNLVTPVRHSTACLLFETPHV
jgi:solute carrier family 25 2-oxodicarboxylate transporter 21